MRRCPISPPPSPLGGPLASIYFTMPPPSFNFDDVISLTSKKEEGGREFGAIVLTSPHPPHKMKEKMYKEMFMFYSSQSSE